MEYRKKLTKPLIFAHRGASRYAPENSMAAFRMAVEQGADGIELDVKLTKDGEVVVFHDSTIDRITGKTGFVNQYKLEDLKNLDIGSQFLPDFSNERIPLLHDVLNNFGDQIIINVELTNYSSPFDSLVEKVATEFKGMKYFKGIIFSSFFINNLIKIKRLLPEYPVAILANRGAIGMINRSWIGRVIAPGIIHPHFNDVNEAFINKQKRMGRRVHTWTVNDPKMIEHLLHIGVNGVITDDPVLAQKAFH